MRTGLVGISTLLAVLLAGCGGGGGADPVDEPAGTPSVKETTAGESQPAGTTASAPTPTNAETKQDVPASGDPQASEGDPESAVGDACSLLDPAYLNDLMQGEKTMFGSPYEFQEPVRPGPHPFCAWKEGSTGLTLQITLEPAATSAIEDHSGRAYNLDVEPVPVPQDGPGTSAVLLTDPAFEDLGSEPFAYGYFFVADDVTVFVESVGLDLGADKLRAMADEAAKRLAAG